MSYARCPPDEGRLPGRPRSRVARELIGAGPGSRFISLFWGGGNRAPPRRFLVRVLPVRPAPPRNAGRNWPCRAGLPGRAQACAPDLAPPCPARRNAGGCEGRRQLGPGAGPRAGRSRGGRAQPATQIAGRLPAEGGPAAARPSSSASGRLGGCTQKLPSCGKRPATGRGQWSLAPNSAAHQMPVFLVLSVLSVGQHWPCS